LLRLPHARLRQLHPLGLGTLGKDSRMGWKRRSGASIKHLEKCTFFVDAYRPAQHPTVFYFTGGGTWGYGWPRGARALSTAQKAGASHVRGQ
jgi:hypothetical protein